MNQIGTFPGIEGFRMNRKIPWSVSFVFKPVESTTESIVTVSGVD